MVVLSAERTVDDMIIQAVTTRPAGSNHSVIGVSEPPGREITPATVRKRDGGLASISDACGPASTRAPLRCTTTVPDSAGTTKRRPLRRHASGAPRRADSRTSPVLGLLA